MKTPLLILSFTLLVIGNSQAQDLSKALQACSAKIDNLARLTCYDRLAKLPRKSAQSHPISAPTPAPQILPAPSPVKSLSSEPSKLTTSPPREAQVEEFGLANKPVEPKNKINKVTGIISKVSKDPYGKLIITLDNQHVWKQNDTENIRLRAGEQIYVEQGALSSFFLSKESVNKRIRVRRIK